MEASNNTAAPVKAGRKVSLRAFLVAILAGVLAGALGYLVGWGLGLLKNDDLVDRNAELQAQVYQLEARRRLSLTIEAIEASNFGIAQENLVAAQQQLRQAPGAEDGILAGLTQELNATQVQAASDITAQKDHLMRLAGLLDRLLNDLIPAEAPAPAPPPENPEPSDDE